jgi:uncharacterized protein (DUF4415 family)
MNESRNSTHHDWKAHDAPDMTDSYWLERLDKVFIHRRCPKLEAPKVSTTIRLDADVLARFRAGVAGGQSRINAAYVSGWRSTARRLRSSVRILVCSARYCLVR